MCKYVYVWMLICLGLSIWKHICMYLGIGICMGV